MVDFAVEHSIQAGRSGIIMDYCGMHEFQADLQSFLSCLYIQ